MSYSCHEIIQKDVDVDLNHLIFMNIYRLGVDKVKPNLWSKYSL